MLQYVLRCSDSVRVLLEVVHQIPDTETAADGDNGDIELMPQIGEHLHAVAELDADPGQEITPDPRTDEREEAEHAEVSFQHAGRK